MSLKRLIRVINHSRKIPEHTIMLFVYDPKILHKHFLWFLLGVKIPPRETENNAYAKYWGDKQRALWYVLIFSGVVNSNYNLFKIFLRFWLAQIPEYILITSFGRCLRYLENDINARKIDYNRETLRLRQSSTKWRNIFPLSAKNTTWWMTCAI